MKTKFVSLILAFAASFLVSAQTLKLVSATSGEPLANVSFFQQKVNSLQHLILKA